MKTLWILLFLIVLAGCTNAAKSDERAETMKSRFDERFTPLSLEFDTKLEESTLEFLFFVDEMRGVDYTAELVSLTVKNDDIVETTFRQEYHKGFHARVDTQQEDGVSFRSYALGTGNYYVCTKPNSNWLCSSLEEHPNDGFQGFFRKVLAANQAGSGTFGAYKALSRTFAGEQTRCFIVEISNDSEDGEYEICMTFESVPVYYKHHDKRSGVYVEVQPLNFRSGVVSSQMNLPVKVVK